MTEATNSKWSFTTIDQFLHQLESTKSEDVEVNAAILNDVINSFAVKFKVPVGLIKTIIGEEKKGPLNLKVVRNKLVNYFKG